MMRAPALTLALLLLAACQIALPGRDRAPEAASPITVGAVAVTTLDAPAPSVGGPSAAAVTPAAPQSAAASAGAASAAAPLAAATAPNRPVPRPAPTAAPALDGVQPAQSAAQAPAMPAEALDPEVEAVPLAAEELACRATGGVWSRVGDTVAHVCVRPTPDAGKSCTRQTDCQTECLARSRTCAPVAPLVGCHPVLQADGREVTLCLE